MVISTLGTDTFVIQMYQAVGFHPGLVAVV